MPCEVEGWQSLLVMSVKWLEPAHGTIRHKKPNSGRLPPNIHRPLRRTIWMPFTAIHSLKTEIAGRRPMNSLRQPRPKILPLLMRWNKRLCEPRNLTHRRRRHCERIPSYYAQPSLHPAKQLRVTSMKLVISNFALHAGRLLPNPKPLGRPLDSRPRCRNPCRNMTRPCRASIGSPHI